MVRHERIWVCLLPVALAVLPVYAAESPSESPATAAPKAVAIESQPHHPLFEQPLRISLGAYYATVSSVAALGTPSGGTGVAIDFENALGLNNYSIVGEASLKWRFARNWRLDLDYFGINRNGTRTLSEAIEWNGQTLNIGDVVETNSKFSDLRVAVGYSFFQRADKEIGLGLGLHVAKSDISISSSTTGASSQNITAPLPVLVFYSNFALTDTWAMGLRVDALSLAYGDYSGDIRAVALDFVYQPYKHVGFGFGWHMLSLNLEVSKPDWSGTLKSSYTGPAAFVSLSY